MLKFHEFVEYKITSETGLRKSDILMIEQEIIQKIDYLLSLNEEEEKKSSFSIGKLWEYFKKAIKALGIMTVMGAVVYVGFRFDIIRKMFPFLSPFIDKIGSKVYEFIAKWTGNFGYDAFMKVINWSKDFATMLVTKAAEMFGITAAIKKAQDALGWATDKASDAGDYLRGDTSTYDNPEWTRSSVHSLSPTWDDQGKLLPKEKWEPWSYDTRSIYPTTPKIDTHFGSPEGLADRFKEKPDWVDMLKNLDNKKR